jgi:hypothetical protein
MEDSGTRLEVDDDDHYSYDDGDDSDAIKNAVPVVFRAYTMEQE